MDAMILRGEPPKAADGSGYGYGYGDGYGSGDGDGDGDGSIEYWVASIDYAVKQFPLTQQVHVSRLVESGAKLAYWRSTKDGKPANGGCGTVARVGLIEEIPGPLAICTAHALHGTLCPPKWNGERIWIVALHQPFQEQDDKIGSLKREFLAEISNPFFTRK